MKIFIILTLSIMDWYDTVAKNEIILMEAFIQVEKN